MGHQYQPESSKIDSRSKGRGCNSRLIQHLVKAMPECTQSWLNKQERKKILVAKWGTPKNHLNNKTRVERSMKKLYCMIFEIPLNRDELLVLLN